jgi:hypothetical protein
MYDERANGQTYNVVLAVHRYSFALHAISCEEGRVMRHLVDLHQTLLFPSDIPYKKEERHK